MSKRVYIETYGCQMNVADSELITGVLAGEGYISVDNEQEADVVLLNTCAVREKAETRILGRLGWLKSAKDKRPELVIGVAGCMAERLKEKLIARAPYVDLVVGPDSYRRLPRLLDEIGPKSDPMVDVRLDRRELYTDIEPVRQERVGGWISVMRGCDKFCSFCVVPFTRGRERSLSPEVILRQAVGMERKGFREVTLLGQTVSSYEVDGKNFASLLRALHARTQLRLRFTSPYPTDFDAELLDALAELPRVGRHLHLPVQSGSTPVLEAMQRRYSAEEYLALIERIHQRLPDFAITTDFIVGFPGETDEDFERTLELSRQVRFNSAYMFKYSERSGTRAARELPDDVPESVKSERLQRLITLQEQSSVQRSQEKIGSEVEVLVEGENPKAPGQAMGRASCFTTTTLLSGSFEPGELVRARVSKATTHTLYAEPLDVAGVGGERHLAEPS
ncbi:MAG: tRNA (N6-isopentenyl adenosine(37)-C2)-methylthiotransferase MiaB [Deltaproteobacteria bacterium]|nr:tRNA (N6-isopentenyl adenosine(37)-C2)-methylthiotransferase MiaB [Deltaproteobacteria bacterium]